LEYHNSPLVITKQLSTVRFVYAVMLAYSPGADFENLSFAAPSAIIGFMIFSYCLVYEMTISKHYPFQKVSDQ